MATPKLEATISGNSKKLVRETKVAAKSLQALEKVGIEVGNAVDQALGIPLKSLATLGAGAAAAAAAVGAAAIAVSAKAISLAREQEQVERKLAAALKATGGIAGITQSELKNLATSLQSVTNFGDEAVIGAESLLLTFTKIGRDVFPRALETVLDMSSAFGSSLKEASIQLGKALNDPIKGVSALQEVGVSFNEQQKEQIRLMTEAGNVAGAQRVILDELQREIGGTARAVADPWIQLGNVLTDIGQVLGSTLKPAFDSLLDNVLPALVEIGNRFEVLAVDLVPKLNDAVEGFFSRFGATDAQRTENLVKALGELIEDLGKGLRDLATPIASVVQVIDLASQFAKVFIALVEVLVRFEGPIDKLERFGGRMKSAAEGILNFGDSFKKAERLSLSFGNNIERVGTSLRETGDAGEEAGERIASGARIASEALAGLKTSSGQAKDALGGVGEQAEETFTVFTEFAKKEDVRKELLRILQGAKDLDKVLSQLARANLLDVNISDMPRELFEAASAGDALRRALTGLVPAEAIQGFIDLQEKQALVAEETEKVLAALEKFPDLSKKAKDEIVAARLQMLGLANSTNKAKDNIEVIVDGMGEWIQSGQSLLDITGGTAKNQKAIEVSARELTKFLTKNTNLTKDQVKAEVERNELLKEQSEEVDELTEAYVKNLGLTEAAARAEAERVVSARNLNRELRTEAQIRDNERRKAEAARIQKLADAGAKSRQIGGRLVDPGTSFVSTSSGLREVKPNGELGGFLQSGGVVPGTGTFSLERGEGVLNPEGMQNLQELLLGALNRGGNTVNLGGLTFNMGGSNGSALREQARALIPEIERAARRGLREALA